MSQSAKDLARAAYAWDAAKREVAEIVRLQDMVKKLHAALSEYCDEQAVNFYLAGAIDLEALIEHSHH